MAGRRRREKEGPSRRSAFHESGQKMKHPHYERDKLALLAAVWSGINIGRDWSRGESFERGVSARKPMGQPST